MIESFLKYTIGEGINSYNCWVNINRLLLLIIMKHHDVSDKLSSITETLLVKNKKL